MGTIKHLLSATADIIWPPRCHICGAAPDADLRWICRHCLENLPLANFGANDLNAMAQNFAGKIPFVRASAYLHYNPKGMLGPVFHDFKYHGYRQLARYMGWLAGFDRSFSPFFNDVDMLLPVPMHPLKQLRRGYNQAEEIAHGLSKEINVPVGNILQAVRTHRTQTGMNAEQRAANTKGLFRYSPAAEHRGMTVCLVDDICTTGSTLLACAEAILSADPSTKIYLFALAYTQY